MQGNARVAFRNSESLILESDLLRIYTSSSICVHLKLENYRPYWVHGSESETRGHVCISRVIVKCCINEGTRKGNRPLHERGDMKSDLDSITYTTRSLPIDISPAMHTYAGVSNDNRKRERRARTNYSNAIRASVSSMPKRI